MFLSALDLDSFVYNAGYQKAFPFKKQTEKNPFWQSIFLFKDMKDGVIGDMATLGITESFQVKRQVLLSAAEAAEMILRVDDIIKAAPRYPKL